MIGIIAEQPRGNWTSGRGYDLYMGCWSAQVAQQFVPWLTVKTKSTWLDVGCGTGQLTSVIIGTQSPQQVLGIDSSEQFLCYARARLKDLPVVFQLADARKLPRVCALGRSDLVVRRRTL